MMTAESMLSKRPVFGIGGAVFFLPNTKYIFLSSSAVFGGALFLVLCYEQMIINMQCLLLRIRTFLQFSNKHLKFKMSLVQIFYFVRLSKLVFHVCLICSSPDF